MASQERPGQMGKIKSVDSSARLAPAPGRYLGPLFSSGFCCRQEDKTRMSAPATQRISGSAISGRALITYSYVLSRRMPESRMLSVHAGGKRSKRDLASSSSSNSLPAKPTPPTAPSTIKFPPVATRYLSLYTPLFINHGPRLPRIQGQARRAG